MLTTQPFNACMYISLIRLHLEYAAPIWSPHLLQDINSLESVQKFELRLCSENWNLGYCELLNLFNLPSLENRRLYFKLCTLFKIVHNLCSSFISNNVLSLISPHSRNNRFLTFHQPFARTVAFRSSFFPDTISYWNCLPKCLFRPVLIVYLKTFWVYLLDKFFLSSFFFFFCGFGYISD